MENSRGLNRKVVVVTGGCGDIGGATARKLSALGARVILFDLLSEKAGSARARQLGAVSYRRVDQADERQVEEGIAWVAKKFNRLDVVIGNAALGTEGSLLDLDVSGWQKVLGVNLIGCAILAKFAVRQMLRQAPDRNRIRGKVLFTSSWVGSYPSPGAIHYCVSKAGIDHLTRLAAQEHAADGIRFNAVAPGILDAGATRKVAFKADPRLREKFITFIPVGEFGTAEQVADAFVFLASRESNYMTGTVLFVDGGCALSNRKRK